VYTKDFSDGGLGVSGVQKSFKLVGVLKVKLFVFLHDNTNITRLAET